MALTFNFPIAPGEQVIAGSLTLGLRLANGTAATSGDERLYLGNTDVFDTFSVLGWNVKTNASSVHTALIVPFQLQNGFLNVAVGPNCGVDFAVLHLQVAPVIPSTTMMEIPIDTFVRGGGYANQNFAGDPELIVKDEGDSDFSRRAFLDWNLGEVGGGLVEAKVRLYCNYSGQTGNEHSASLVKEQGWSPNSVTWNTQPAAAPPFAYWTPEPGTFAEFTVTPEVNAALVGDKRFAIALKSAQDFGSHGDVAYASREDPDPARRPQLILRFTNSPPTIVAPANRTVAAGSTLSSMAVTIGDDETAAGSLTLTASSSAPDIIDDSNITLGGSGADRTISITVPPGRTGPVIITLRVTPRRRFPRSAASPRTKTRQSSSTSPSVTPRACPQNSPSGFQHSTLNSCPREASNQRTASAGGQAAVRSFSRRPPIASALPRSKWPSATASSPRRRASR